MERIYPLTVEKISPYIGKPVCAVLHNGECIQGIVSDVREGKIFFSPRAPGSAVTGKSSAKKQPKKVNHRSTRSSKSSQNAGVSSRGYPGYPGYPSYPDPGYPGFGYPGYGRAFALDLALIALLFAIPFIGFPFWI